MRPVIALLLLLVSAPADAQTWAELGAVKQETRVRIYEVGGKGWSFVDGKLLLVKDNELTILRGSRPVMIPRASISRVEKRRRDSPLQGALIGVLIGALIGGGQGCSQGDSKCLIGGMAVYGGLGTVIDWQIPTKRTVYRTP